MQPPPANLFLLNPQHRRVLANPRQYCRLRDQLGMLLVIAFLLFWLVGWTAGIGWLLFEITNKAQLAQSGVAHTATVQARDQWRSDDTDRCSVTYTFTYRQPNGEPASQTNTSDLPCTRYNDVEPGVELPIWYVPASPTTSTVLPPTLPWGEMLFALLPLIAFWLLGVAFLVVFGVSWYTCVRLAQNGTIYYGTIETATSEKDNDGDYHVNVTATLISPRTGAPLTITDSRVRQTLKEDPLPARGTPVAILYSNDKQHKLL